MNQPAVHRPVPTPAPPRGPWPEPPAPHAPPAPPGPVVGATWLVVAGAVLELAASGFEAVMFLTGPSGFADAAVASIVWGVVAVAVLLPLALGLRRGSNGCRLALTVLGVGWVLTSPAHVSAWTASVVADDLEILAVVATLVLVYLPASSRFFAGAPAAGAAVGAGGPGPWAPGTPVGTAITADPAVRRARSLGWRVLGVVVGLGLPLSLGWAFIVAWGASDGCSGGSTRPQCATTTLLLSGSAPAIATGVATVLAVVALALARTHPAVSHRLAHAGLVAWFVLGIGLYALAQHG